MCVYKKEQRNTEQTTPIDFDIGEEILPHASEQIRTVGTIHSSAVESEEEDLHVHTSWQTEIDEEDTTHEASEDDEETCSTVKAPEESSEDADSERRSLVWWVPTRLEKKQMEAGAHPTSQLKPKTAFSGGPELTGTNTIVPEHEDSTTAADRGSVPLEDDTHGTDSRALATMHSQDNVDKSKVPPTMYGYEDYTGVSFHAPSEANVFTHVMCSITVSTEYKSEEYDTSDAAKCKAAIHGQYTNVGDYPCAEPTKMNYSTQDVVVSVTHMLLGAAAYMGDPKADHILAHGDVTDSQCPGESGKKGAPVATRDSMNVEWFGPITMESAAGKIPDVTPVDYLEQCTTAVMPVLNADCAQQTTNMVHKHNCKAASEGCSTAIATLTVLDSGHPYTFVYISTDADETLDHLDDWTASTIMGSQGELSVVSLWTVVGMYKKAKTMLNDSTAPLLNLTLGNEKVALKTTNESHQKSVDATPQDMYALGYVRQEESKSTHLSSQLQHVTLAYGEPCYCKVQVQPAQEPGTLKENTSTSLLGDASETDENGVEAADMALVGSAPADGSGTGDAGNAATCDCQWSVEDGTTTAASITELGLGQAPVGLDTALCGPAHACILEDSSLEVQQAASDAADDSVADGIMDRGATKNWTKDVSGDHARKVIKCWFTTTFTTTEAEQFCGTERGDR